MTDTKNDITSYLELTGQTKQELFAGSSAFGMSYILNDLVPKALKEQKKIVWKDEPEKGIGAMSFTLEDL